MIRLLKLQECCGTDEIRREKFFSDATSVQADLYIWHKANNS